MPQSNAGEMEESTAGGQRHGARGLLALFGIALGAVGFSASLTAVYMAMRELMINSGGFCASGGPYAIQNQCDGGQIALLMGGVVALVVFGGVLAAASSAYGGTSFMGAGLLMWAALFGALGFNFIQLGFNPPSEMSGAAGWIISGVVFWLMALGGLIPGLAEVVSFMRRGDRPEPSMFKAPLVRAKAPVPPISGFPEGVPGSAPVQADSPPPGASPAGSSGLAAGSEFVDPVTGEKFSGTAGGGASASPAGAAPPGYQPPTQPNVPKRIVIPPSETSPPRTPDDE